MVFELDVRFFVNGYVKLVCVIVLLMISVSMGCDIML